MNERVLGYFKMYHFHDASPYNGSNASEVHILDGYECTDTQNLYGHGLGQPTLRVLLEQRFGQ